MEILISALELFLNWELYVLCAISLLIYKPYAIWLEAGNKLTPFKFFGAPFIGILLQAVATIFLYVSIWFVFSEEMESFINLLMVSAWYTFNFTELGMIGVFISITAVCLLLILFGDNDFDFLIGIFLFSWIVYGDWIPAFPSISTTLMIIGATFFNLYISPWAIFPINKLLGNDNIGETYKPDMLETIAIQYVQTVVGLLPAFIYLMWLIFSL